MVKNECGVWDELKEVAEWRKNSCTNACEARALVDGDDEDESESRG